MKLSHSLFALATCFSSAAFASNDLRPVFEKLFTDSRVSLESCGSSNGLTGIDDPKTVKVCTATLNADSKKTVLLIKEPGKAVEVYDLRQKLTRSVIDPDGGAFGLRTWKIQVRALDKNLELVHPVKVGYGKIDESWEYSEGYVAISGRTPSGKSFSSTLEPMNAPIYNDLE